MKKRDKTKVHTEVLYVWVTPKIKKTLTEEAAARGLSISHLTREIMENAIYALRPHKRS